ncbi:hypothetical protein QBC36DRAFT_362793 [Triangularia setosa]|uniref:Uncharacterized protein n=1 Tax=Triangularia setosa TaxID=2587417 RepID=A0AAN7A4S2_9PEZI|nr:hypothetical protein QBC36DRAFT_362793 [Podospora setosa]
MALPRSPNHALHISACASLLVISAVGQGVPRQIESVIVIITSIPVIAVAISTTAGPRGMIIDPTGDISSIVTPEPDEEEESTWSGVATSINPAHGAGGNDNGGITAIHSHGSGASSSNDNADIATTTYGCTSSISFKSITPDNTSDLELPLPLPDISIITRTVIAIVTAMVISIQVNGSCALLPVTAPPHGQIVPCS